MTRHSSSRKTGSCIVCGRSFSLSSLHEVGHLRPYLHEMIMEEVPGCGADSLICDEDLGRFRRRYVEKLLDEERGELSDLDRRVLDTFETGASTVQAGAAMLERSSTFGERVADRVAAFGGSWTFILLFMGVLIAWMGLNVSGLFVGPFDPYPFILLNLVLSCVAALQAPVIMMSQKRQEDKDRRRSENDYMINLRAEMEIRQLHEKIDHQMARQWERLTELQQIQIELLERRDDRRPE